MKKMKKRCLALMLAVSTAISCIPGGISTSGADISGDMGIEALSEAGAETPFPEGAETSENPEIDAASGDGLEGNGPESDPASAPEESTAPDTWNESGERPINTETEAETAAEPDTGGPEQISETQEYESGTENTSEGTVETETDTGAESEAGSAGENEIESEESDESAGEPEPEQETEWESETETEQESETESGLHKVYLMQDALYTLNMEQDKYEYAEGEIVTFTAEPSSGVQIVSAGILQVLNTEEPGQALPEGAEEISDFLDLSGTGEEPELLLVSGESVEAVREAQPEWAESGKDKGTMENAEAAEEPGITGASGAASDPRTGEAAEDTYESYGVTAGNEETDVQYHFTMPDADVIISCSTEAAAAAAASAASEEEGIPEVDHAELIVDTVPGPAQYPQQLVNGSRRLWTSVKHVRLYDSSGNLIDTCLAYCMQPSLGGPDSGTNVPESRIDELETGTKDRTLAKILYYLYGGPAWGREVTDRNGNVLNYRQLMEAIGCSADGNCLAVTHLVLGYVCDNSRWNYGCDAMGNPVANALNTQGQNAIRDLAEKIKNMPDPRAEFSASTASSYYENGQVRSESITYHANADNSASVKLPAGISLYNETTGTVQTGTVTISGGDRFHLIADGVSGNGSYVFTTTFATDFSAYKISFPGKQDLGFSYTAGDKKISLSVDWKAPRIPVMVRKTSENPDITAGNGMYSLAGAVFKLYQGSTEAASFCTDENGNTDAVEVEPGTYTLKETVTPKGFKKAKDQTVILKAGDGTKTIQVADEPLTGTCGILLKKVIAGEVGTDIPLGGAQFQAEFYGSEQASGKPLRIWVFETDQNGTASFSSRYLIRGDALYKDGILPLGTLKVKEIKAPAGFQLDTAPQTVQITQSGETAVFSHTQGAALFQFADQYAFGGIRIKKEDKENGTAQGDASLAGAEFAVYNANDYAVVRSDDTSVKYEKGQEVCRITSDEAGIARTPEIQVNGATLQLLQAGTYTIKEVTAPKGYVLENYSHTFTIAENGQILDLSDTPARDRVIRFDLTLQKFRDTSDQEEPGEDLVPLEGIVFGIYLEATGEKILTIATDADGVASTRDQKYPYGRLPYGRYVVKEEKYPAGVVPVSDFVVEGTEDGKEYKGIYKNDVPVEEYLELKKVDAETGKAISTGAVFQILDAQKNVVSFRINHPRHQVITDFTTDENGTVTLPERLPYGTYYLHEIKAPEGYLCGEDLKFQVTTRNSWESTLTITYKDLPVKGIIRLTKLDGDTEETLSGAVFQVFAAEDIVTGDGTVRLAKDAPADTITVGKDGTGCSKELYPGNYYIRETQAPEGYYRDTARHEVALTCQDDHAAVVYADVSVKNRPTKFQLLKKDTDGEVLSGVTFKITNQKKFIDGEASAWEEGDSVSDTTDSEGRIQVSKLTPGIYSIQETETLPGYVPDPALRYFTVDEDGSIFESDSDGRKLSPDEDGSDRCFIEWENDYTKWDFSKVDINGDGEIPGAEMTILDQDGKEIESWISGKEAHRISRLPAGDYTLVERTAPDGYVLASEIPFTVTETAVVQLLTVTDKQVFVKKVNPDGTDVPGAVLELRDTEGTVLDTWETDGHPHAANGLAVGGTYVLAEIRAPEGYVEGAPVTFTVADDGLNQVVLMIDKQVYAYKIDTCVRSMAGAQLEVRQDSPEGRIVDSWTSDGTAHAISGLRIGGTYVLVETRALEGYALASPIPFTVQDNGENDTFRMVNKRVWMSKRSVTGSEEIPGASIQVFDRDGNQMDAWISGEEPHPISNLTVGETYILHEEAAPEGYVTATDITFLVTDDYTDQQVVLKNKQVLVSKQMLIPKQLRTSQQNIPENQEIGGAVLSVLDQAGRVIDTWTTVEGEKHPISGLAVNQTYTLREETAPDGYIRAEEITFTVEEDFRIQTVEMLDDTTKVEITKTDITNGQLLPGAELVIRDSDGNEMERWTTGTQPHYIQMLPVGDYTLTEITAPDGYEIAETVRFTVEETGEIQRVEMKDRLKAPSEDVPRTGDGTKLEIWIMLLLVSAAAAVLLLKKKKSADV